MIIEVAYQCRNVVASLRRIFCWTIVLTAALIATACKPTLTCDGAHACPTKNTKGEAENLSNGFSGMAQIDDNNFLVVHDYHNYGFRLYGRRLGVVSVSGEGSKPQYRYRYLENVHLTNQIEVWPRVLPNVSHGEVANDLESVCALNGHKNQFLVAESGTYNDGADKVGGRIFRVTLNSDLQSYDVAINPQALPGIHPTSGHTTPTVHARTGKQSLENYEGMACWQLPSGNADKYLVLLGERGSTAPVANIGNYENVGRTKGTLQWAIYDPGNDKFRWQAPHNRITAPGMHKGGVAGCWRDISGLHVDDDRKIWATAAYDSAFDDVTDPCNQSAPANGKNRSVVYQLGAICLQADDSILPNGGCSGHARYPVPVPLDSLIETRKIEGYKIEAIAAPQGSGNSELTIASEDETAAEEEKGGSWWNKR